METNSRVLNCRVDLCGTQEALDCAYEAIKKDDNFHIVTINPEMIMYAQKNPAFFEILENSDLNIIDGVGVKIALKLKGQTPNQIRGVDFSRSLLAFAHQLKLRVAFLGAKEEVIKAAKENFLKKLPGLNFVYTRNGYFESDDEIIQEIAAQKPQVLLVGLGSPKQEEMIVKLKEILRGCIMVGVGGSFDVFSGLTKESPVIFQKLGLEWLYRTICEPKRFKRIFPVLPLFLIKCIINTIQEGEK